jgi:hypothetical protein
VFDERFYDPFDRLTTGAPVNEEGRILDPLPVGKRFGELRDRSDPISPRRELLGDVRR